LLPEQKVEEAAEAIEAYLTDHPNAADTLEGVITWWLARSRYLEAHELVQHAMEHLVSMRVVSKHEGPGGAALYRLNRQ
jgi:hypothetical protein